MQNSKSRSGPLEMAPKGSISSPRSMQAPSRTTKGTGFSSSPSTRTSSIPEQRIVRGPELQLQFNQLQAELKKVTDERTKALEELEELRSTRKMSALNNKEEMDNLEKKVEKAKDSERKMLESLIAQTKQLEVTKISLEEAKLEIRSLQEIIKSMEESSSRNKCDNLEKQQSPVHMIQTLRSELKSATEAEDKSKKAMDDLAVALKEVTTEANQVKEKLSLTQSELEKAKLEAKQSKSLVAMIDGKLRAAVEESERLRMELEDLPAQWKEKESGFLNCIQVSEEEIIKLKLENSKLIESIRGSRDETSKLRDIVKQAINESTVVKEALEIARNENSQLKDLLSEKESALQSLRQEYECVKVSEAAAVDSVKELKGFLAAANSSIDSTTETSIGEQKERNKMMKFPSEQYCRGDAKIQNGRRNSLGAPEKFKDCTFGVDGHPADRKDRLFSSISNVSAARVPSSLYSEDRETMSVVDFDHFGRIQSNDEMGSPTRQKKKKAVLKRFGDMFRRRSFHK